MPSSDAYVLALAVLLVVYVSTWFLVPLAVLALVVALGDG